MGGTNFTLVDDKCGTKGNHKEKDHLRDPAVDDKYN
jgi:hypothetical protein